jgi:hypothetical protein
MATTIPPPRDSHSHNPGPEPARKSPGDISPLVDQPAFAVPFTPTPTLPVTTNIRCPYDGLAATGDLAPNPNLVGGNFAPDYPLPPNWAVSPFANAAVGGLGQWLLIVGNTCRHRTLWNVSRLTEITIVTPPVPWVPIV